MDQGARTRAGTRNDNMVWHSECCFFVGGRGFFYLGFSCKWSLSYEHVVYVVFAPLNE